ncbi:MAG: GNAT family N-acetyltransferase [Actinomycetota bacterium]
MEDGSTSVLTERHAVFGDGLHVVFRPIRPEDKDLLRCGFERLSPQSRYRRFFRAIDHLSDKQLAYLTEVDFKDHYAWVALDPSDEECPGIGVARWIRAHDDPTAAEAAVTVVDAYQHIGIGTALMFLAGRSAIENGIRAIRVNALGDNKAVSEMLKDLGVVAGRWEAGVMEAEIPLPETVEELDQSPGASVFRAMARGDLESHLDARGPGLRAHLSKRS